MYDTQGATAAKGDHGPFKTGPSLPHPCTPPPSSGPPSSQGHRHPTISRHQINRDKTPSWLRLHCKAGAHCRANCWRAEGAPAKQPVELRPSLLPHLPTPSALLSLPTRAKHCSFSLTLYRPPWSHRTKAPSSFGIRPLTVALCHLASCLLSALSPRPQSPASLAVVPAPPVKRLRHQRHGFVIAASLHDRRCPSAMQRGGTAVYRGVVVSLQPSARQLR